MPTVVFKLLNRQGTRQMDRWAKGNYMLPPLWSIKSSTQIVMKE